MIPIIRTLTHLVAGHHQRPPDELGYPKITEDQQDAGIEVESRQVVDLMDEAASIRYPEGGKWRGAGKVKRTYHPPRRVAHIDTIVVHQTAVHRSPAATAARAVHATYHAVVDTEGTVYLLHPLSCRLVSSHAADRAPWHAINIAAMGSFDDEQGRNWGIGRTTLGEAQIAGMHRAITTIYALAVAGGAQPRHILGHRQFHSSRGADPGPELWRHVVAPMADHLGLDTLSGRAAVKAGRDVPQGWWAA